MAITTMKRKNTTKINAKFKNWALVFACIFAVSLILPFISGNGEVVLMAVAFGQFLSNGQLAGVLILIALVGVIVGSRLIVFSKRKGVLALVGTALGAIGVIAAFMTLFTIKEASDYVGYVGGNFLMRNLNVAWYVFFLASLGTLFFSLRVVKIDTAYILITALCVIWIIPILWIFVNSFRVDPGQYSPYFFPREWTIRNYLTLFSDTERFRFGRWFLNTLLVSTISMTISAIVILSTAYALSRSKSRRKPLIMMGLLIVGMFPGFMAMTAVYFLLQWIGLHQSLIALIAIYSGSSALQYLIVKGFFDTLPKSIEEAAYIDGATKLRVFIKIMIPLSKPIIIFTLLTTFIIPWGDFIFASFLLRGGDNANFTVAMGLFDMLDSTYVETWYTRFAAGAIIVAVPIAGLFIALQKYYTQGSAGAVKG
ncbi:MAG: ABC transporter permease subunit [Firmicutes bacterium]|nr:ABC transporter permease subunit [Bacillota bacterium]